MQHPFTDAQRLGLDLDRHIVMDAGAGTGKTTVMVERYVQHLLTPQQRAVLVTPQGSRMPSELGSGGSLEAPRDRILPKDWPGLLPSEVVAITFTRKAASSLNSRIKDRISAVRGEAEKGDEHGIVDVRWRGIDTGVVDLLSSMLDDAPISTIDAFLSRLIAPFVDELMPRRVDGVVPEEQVEALHLGSMASVWRMRGVSDATRLGIPQGAEVLAARDRLTVALGGQGAAHTVLGSMLRSSAFVEEARQALFALSEGGVDPSTLRHLVARAACGPSTAEEDLMQFVEQLRTALADWHGHVQTRSEEYVGSKEKKEGTQTRFRQLRRWCDAPPPATVWEALRWLYGAVRIVSSEAVMKAQNYASAFHRGGLPSDLGWPAGVKAVSWRGSPDTAKVAFMEGCEARIQAVRDLLEEPQHHWWVLLGACALDLEPGLAFEFLPADVNLWPTALAHPLPITPPEGRFSTGSAFAVRLLQDLFIVHDANRRAADMIKAEQGLIDFEDVQRMAADLLLARCPDMLRSSGCPIPVVEALDALPPVLPNGEDGPWSDAHIRRALAAASDHPWVVEDLQRRWARLRRIRREYRAFIIDEFQDTNPAHFRLLARLWGARELRQGDPDPALGDWEPTVCVVGDVKQSIYRFRQADVRVMHQTVGVVREMNRLELADARLLPFREPEAGRDPRPVGDGGTSGGVRSALHHVPGEGGAPWSFVSFGDDSEQIERRRLGHIELDENWRTEAPLMRTMNGLFTTVLGSATRAMDGDWYAAPQPLTPMRPRKGEARLEWLMPVNHGGEGADPDLRIPFQTSEDPLAKQRDLENDLIASRIAALLDGEPVALNDDHSVPATAPVRPDDVLVLVHSRTRAAGLVRRLRDLGVPVMVDRQGDLLDQPVVQPLMAALEALARPFSAHAAVVLGRSAAFALDDASMDAVLSNVSSGTTVWHALAEALDERRAALALRCEAVGSAGGLHAVLDLILDESDLLVAYPSDADRQHAERFCLLALDLAGRYGEDPVVLLARLGALQGLERDGPAAVVEPSGGAVEIMTIHNAKGLERDVVVVAGLFSAGRSDASLAAQDNVLVLPDLVVARAKPWPTHTYPEDALWRMAKALDDAQAMAERVRQLYVAMTRAERHLILAGAPEGAVMNADGALEIPLSSSATRTFGDHLLIALVNLANEHGHAHPYNVLVDEKGKRWLVVDPVEAWSDAGLGEDGIDRLLVLHRPEQFPHRLRSTPLLRLEAATSLVEDEKHLEAAAEVAPVIKVDHRLRVTPHGLDTAKSCRRRHWLGAVRGWVPERFGAPAEDEAHKPRDSEDDGSATAGWPAATLFGTMVHRAVELGLANPARGAVQPPLPSSWTQSYEGRLLDPALLERVLEEHGGPETVPEKVRSRIQDLLALIDRGPLGRLVAGEQVHGRTVQGLRTEHPFFAALPAGDHLERSAWRDGGRKTIAVAPLPLAEVDGRIDLVLALDDAVHGPSLQVVDLKTTGSREGWEHHPLRDLSTLLDEADGRTAAERAELDHYALQLTLYTLALLHQESSKPEEERRHVLPPALLLSASGRVVEMTAEELESSMRTVMEHIEWMTHLSFDPEAHQEPERLPVAQKETCFTCPHFNGEIRLCGPEGFVLGVQPNGQA